MDMPLPGESAKVDDHERHLGQAILLRALMDLKSSDDEVVKEALDWLVDEPGDVDPDLVEDLLYRDGIVDICTNLHQDDITRLVRKIFRED